MEIQTTVVDPRIKKFNLSIILKLTIICLLVLLCALLVFFFIKKFKFCESNSTVNIFVSTINFKDNNTRVNIFNKSERAAVTTSNPTSTDIWNPV